ncbi:hypothetical protein GGR06_002075 [Bacteroides reticulotermitis]|nr:hypothetical protein [Bacteroides reticulotermitis]
MKILHTTIQKYAIYFCGIGCLMPIPLTAQFKQQGDVIESVSQHDPSQKKQRTLQYRPEGDAFVSVNGKNRFTRALYGGHTPFRLETSDVPVFAIYDNGMQGNISFSLQLADGTILPFDQVAHCEARYQGGKRSYLLTDPAWGKGEVRMEVLALSDADGAIWKISSTALPKGSIIKWQHGGITGKRFSRNGDMGVDPKDCFELKPDANDLIIGKLAINKEVYLIRGKVEGLRASAALFAKAEKARTELTSRFRIETPDAYMNTLGGALMAAADGIWDGEVWLHGAIGWRMPLSGWRAAYTGDALGWHDRARTHFNAYANSQVTEVPNTIPHPAQDPEMNLARSEKEWGTPQYSNGYICRNPNKNNQMHHYDMNLCYIDELLWHFNWTGDKEYVRKMWPVLTRHLAWEKLNYDPNNDGLYDAYACIWASDALYYNSGAVTHSTAYNYRSNKTAALLAELIGEDPAPYRAEAEKILAAVNKRLWMPSAGCWAEYEDFMGHRRLHESPGVWTIYHAIDGETADPFQAYQATRYVDTEIPHIPVEADGLDGTYATIATTNWLPYSWSVNNVAFAEVMHTALAYFLAGRPEEGYRLMKSSVLDGMYLGDSPGNFGQISTYDAARGECYRDFGDPVGVASRLLVQGLFGIIPDALNGKLLIRPGFPTAWDHASVALPEIAYNFRRVDDTDTYCIEQHRPTSLALTLQVNATREKIKTVKVNGKEVAWNFVSAAAGYPVIAVTAPAVAKAVVEICWEGASLGVPRTEISYRSGAAFSLPASDGITFKEIFDPQGVLVQPILIANHLSGQVLGKPGHRTLFLRLQQGEMQWWQPVNVIIEKNQREVPGALPYAQVDASQCRPVVMDVAFNAKVTDIFRNEYLTPRSPYTTLQLPKQGIGEWCHPKLIAEIDDSGLRAPYRNGLFDTGLGVQFRTPSEGANIAFTSLWDNYPDSLAVPLSGTASHAYLMLAGSTNHMQCRIANGVIRVYYEDGTSDTLELVNPDNWCPIEQDFFIDGQAFHTTAPRPYRFHLKSGLVSNDLGKALKIDGVYGRAIEGGAGVLLDMPLNPSKKLNRLTLETVANDVVIGLMGITLQ